MAQHTRLFSESTLARKHQISVEIYLFMFILSMCYLVHLLMKFDYVSFRYNCMNYYKETHPEEKFVTVGDHLKLFNKFGFTTRDKVLTKKELAMEGMIYFTLCVISK